MDEGKPSKKSGVTGERGTEVAERYQFGPHWNSRLTRAKTQHPQIHVVQQQQQQRRSGQACRTPTSALPHLAETESSIFTAKATADPPLETDLAIKQ